MPEPRGYRQLTPEEVNQEAIQETWTRPEILIPLMMSAMGGVSSFFGRPAQSAYGELSPTMQQYQKAIQPGMRQRIWKGIYQGPLEQGTSIPSPGWTGGGATAELPAAGNTAAQLKKLLEGLGGTYTGPTGGM